MRPDRPLLGKPSRPRLRGLPLDLLLAGSLDDAERRAGHVRAEVVDADRNPVAGRVRKRVGLDVERDDAGVAGEVIADLHGRVALRDVHVVDDGDGRSRERGHSREE